MGYLDFDEPFKSLVHQGTILGPDGQKMSKSLGNVVDPLDVVAQYGADTLRTYVLFMGDYGSAAPWNDSSVRGCKRFLDRVSDLRTMVKGTGATPALESSFHKTIKKVSDDIEEMKFNTAIAAMMALINEIYDCGSLTADELRIFARLLCPFAPHLCEEIWEGLGETGFCSLAAWPTYDEEKTVDSAVEIAVQIKGKVRGRIMVPASLGKDDGEKLLENETVKKLVGDAQVKKIIFVPGRLLNIVVG